MNSIWNIHFLILAIILLLTVLHEGVAELDCNRIISKIKNNFINEMNAVSKKKIFFCFCTFDAALISET